MKSQQFLIFSVTNDLSYDQRMIRICTSLSEAGYSVLLVGRKLPQSIPPAPTPYRQHRLNCFFTKGFLFYVEFNLRLFFFLLFKKATLLCAIDLDTILPVYLISLLKNIPRVYDAHELFCEMKEVASRPPIYKTWKWIEKRTVPHFSSGYTVNTFIREALYKLYKVDYEIIRNLPVSIYNVDEFNAATPERFILYQGAVNEGRCFETLIPAMRSVPSKLIICGDGNFMHQAKKLVTDHHLENKITFTGWLPPVELRAYTAAAYIGVNIIEDNGLSNHYSLSNRFFDYIQSALPQVCVNYPAYREINDEFHCALMIDSTDASTIAEAINTLLSNESLYHTLRQNCIRARESLNWNQEQKRLLDFYQNIFSAR